VLKNGLVSISTEIAEALNVSVGDKIRFIKVASKDELHG
jgi:predicted lysophospholipase L1 biosynthesis ABC-type transport system permease subunit